MQSMCSYIKITININCDIFKKKKKGVIELKKSNQNKPNQKLVTV